MYQDRAVRIKDTDTHRPGMQVDAAVKSVLLQVESHHGPPSKRGAGCLVTTSIPVCEEAMMSITQCPHVHRQANAGAIVQKPETLPCWLAGYQVNADDPCEAEAVVRKRAGRH